MSCLVVRTVLLGSCGLLWTTIVMAQTYAIPAVVRGVAGSGGSFWASELRVLRRSLSERVTVRRTWVALQGGGSADGASGPSWTLEAGPGHAERVLILTGEELLQGTSAPQGVVGVEVAGDAWVLFRAANSQGKPRLPDDGSGACCWPGNGQAGMALGAALEGPSTIPWLSAGKSVFRNNIALVNPNPGPLSFRVWVRIAAPAASASPGREWEEAARLLPIDVSLPAWGWTALNDVFSHYRLAPCPVLCPPFFTGVAPAYVSIEPTSAASYYAYASVIYSPLNDPEFVPALPGRLDWVPSQ